MIKRIAIVGCGDISQIYIDNLKEHIEIAAFCDINLSKAKAKAEHLGIERVMLPQELWQSNDIDTIINLTIPNVHYDITMMALEAGKNVYSEKPIAINILQSQSILKLAKKKNLFVGVAPDTFLGGAHQAAKRVIDSGVIGKPIAVNSFMMAGPPENWHPDPGFLYRKGAGPLFDMGPYYLTAMTNLIGSISFVNALGDRPSNFRTIKSEAKFGEKIPVEVPTYVTGAVEFASGVIGNLTTTFDVAATKLPHIEIYCTEGTLVLPDPNFFGGEVWCYTNEKKEWELIAPENDYVANNRGIGFLEMVQAVRNGSEPIASGKRGHHILEVMQGFIESIETKKRVQIFSSCPKQEHFLGL